ncbi:MAG: peptidase m20 [Crocinitomicaceae bacterium]|jgi:acetylornithine deacetylase/succinyl-diaminopimelate desuccinylase-like protein|nr:peptidase m20 [Crocinitomicaceae bacterium]
MLRPITFIASFFILANVFSQNAPIREPEKLLQKLIRFRSYSGEEKELGLYLRKFCDDAGLFTREFIAVDGSYNFTASLYPLEQKKENIILTSHFDVVQAADSSLWTHDPFAGKIVNDTLFGRGSIDCLGLAVMQIYSIIGLVDEAKKTSLPYNVTFLGVSGEEVNSSYGAKFIVEQHLPLLNPVVVFGEGGSGLTNLVPSKPQKEVFGISVAEKSSLWLRLDVTKKTHGHGAVPPDLYANKRLLKSLINLMDQKKEVKFSKLSRKMFRELGKLEGGAKGFVIKHINWSIFWPFVKKYFREGEIFNVLVENTFVITEIGTIDAKASNQIASGAYAVLDCRLLPGTDIKKFIRRVQFAVGLKVDVSIISESPNSPPSEITPYFERMQQALQTVYPESFATPFLFPASTDNNFFRLANVPTYGIIPCVLSRGSLEGVHGTNEYLPVKDLRKGIEAYTAFLNLNFKR